MIQHSETKDFALEKLQLVKEQPTQSKEGIVSNVIIDICWCHKLSLSLYSIIIITQIYLKVW